MLAWIIIGALLILNFFVSIALVKMTKPDKCDKCKSKNIRVIKMDEKKTVYQCKDCQHTFEI